MHDKGFIPRDTAHNDYIFAVIAEELGFRGSLLLLTAFALLLIQGLFIAFYSRDVSGRLLVCLIVALFFAHVFESIGMCVLIMPITGIPLPLVSYSGTFVVICMFLLGLVQSVWIHRNRKPELQVAKAEALSTRQRLVDDFQHEIRVRLVDAHRRLDAQRVAEEAALADEQAEVLALLEDGGALVGRGLLGACGP